jgi:hypothetical protein
MLTASSDRAVTTQQGDRQAQYWAFFTHDEVPCWPFVPHGPEDRKAAEAPAPQSRPPVGLPMLSCIVVSYDRASIHPRRHHAMAQRPSRAGRPTIGCR